MLLKINPVDPDKRKIDKVLDCLKAGGVIIYPTDTLYGIGCDIFNTKAIERIHALQGEHNGSLAFSFLCSSLSQISEYSMHFDTNIYKIMKNALPGPYTFVLKANTKSFKYFKKTNKKTIEVRIPENYIINEIDTSSHWQVQKTQYNFLGSSDHFELEVSAKREGFGAEPIDLIFKIASPSEDFFKFLGYTVWIYSSNDKSTNLSRGGVATLTKKDNKWFGEISFEIDAISYEELTKTISTQVRIHKGAKASLIVNIGEQDNDNIRRALFCIK